MKKRSLFIVVNYFGGPVFGRVFEIKLDELDHRQGGGKDETPTFKYAAQLYQGGKELRKPILWKVCTLATPTSCNSTDLCVLPDSGPEDFRMDDPLSGYIFNASPRKQNKMKPPNAPKFFGHVLSLNRNIYFITDPYWIRDAPDPSFERYDPIKDSWESLTTFPEMSCDAEMVGYAVFDDFILFNISGHTCSPQLWAYDVSRNKWYLVSVDDSVCYGLRGLAVVLEKTVYGLSSTLSRSVLALSITREQIDGQDLVFTCSLQSVFTLPYTEVLPLDGDRGRDHLVHLSNDEFCLVQSGICYGYVDYQPIRLSIFQLLGENVVDVTFTIDYEVPLQDFEPFHVRLCFSLPGCEEIVSEQEDNSNIDFTFDPYPAFEVVKPAPEEGVTTLSEEEEEEVEETIVYTSCFKQASEVVKPAPEEEFAMLSKEEEEIIDLSSCKQLLMVPASSSVHSRGWKYDVFLSFRGEDTRKSFISHLYHELQCVHRIKTFMGDGLLERGGTISEIFRAIEESRFAIVVLSQNYASSIWCLKEIAKIFEVKTRKVVPIFYHVYPADVRNQRGSFAEAFTEHDKKHSTKDVQEWRDALRRVAMLSGLDSKNFESERELIEWIVKYVRSEVHQTITLSDPREKLVAGTVPSSSLEVSSQNNCQESQNNERNSSSVESINQADVLEKLSLGFHSIATKFSEIHSLMERRSSTIWDAIKEIPHLDILDRYEVIELLNTKSRINVFFSMSPEDRLEWITSIRCQPSRRRHQWEHDVYLTFMPQDTRKGFVSHLCHELQNVQQMKIFMNDQGERGTETGPELLKAIERSRFAIVVLSPNFASSAWCLDELVHILECRSSLGTTVVSIFFHVNPWDVRRLSGSFSEAFTKHEIRYEDHLEKVLHWRAALQEVSNIAGWVLDKYEGERELIEHIVYEGFSEITSQKERKTEYEGNSHSLETITQTGTLERFALSIQGILNLMEKRKSEKESSIWDAIKETPNLGSPARYKAIEFLDTKEKRYVFKNMSPEERSNWITYKLG